MKKLIGMIAIIALPYFSFSQSCQPQSCDKKACGPEGTKKAEAAVITTMRSELQTVIVKMSKSSLSFDEQIAGMTIEQGGTDDESLLFLSQAVNSIRYEFLNKVDASKQIAALKEYKPESLSSKQKMVANLKKEIKTLAAQAERL